MRWQRLLIVVGLSAIVPSTVLGKVVVNFGTMKGPDEVKIYQKLISQFEKLNPNIKVKINQYTGDYREKILMQFVSGNAPDCFETGLEDYPLYPKSGYLLPIDRYVVKSILGDYPKEMLKAFTYKGKLYALTRDASPLVLLYNKKMFSQAGIPYPDNSWTWSAYTEVLSKFRHDTNNDGNPDIWGFAGSVWENFVWQAGGDLYDDRETPTKLTLGTSEALAGLQFAADLVFKHKVSARAHWGDVSLFASGKAAAVIGGYWERLYGLRNTKITWDAAAVPSGKERATTMYTTAYPINKVSKHPDATFKWIDFVCGPVGQREMSNSGLAMASRMSLAKELVPKNTPPDNGEAFLQSLSYARLAYHFGFRKPTAEINANLTDLWLGKATAVQCVTKMEKSVNSLIARLK